MNRILIVLCLLGLFAVGSIRAQDFRVLHSTPPTGSAGVALDTEVVFQFSDAVDINTDWNRSFFVEPRIAVDSRRIFLGLDDQGRPAIVEFTVEHLPNTDFVWLVYDVENKDGVSMTEPFVLQYTTAPSIGALSVSGAIGPALGKRSVFSAELSHLLQLAQESGWLKAQSASADAVNKVVMQDGHVLVLLLNHFAVRSSTWDVKSATVVAETADSYSLEYLRDGTYWPLAVKYAGGGEDIESVGFYDADADGEPDSVVVSGESQQGINLTMVDYPRTTARAWLSAARDEAARFASDQELLTIRGRFGTTFEGLAYAWGFEFYSPSENLLTSVRIDPIGATADTSEAPASVAGLRRITDPFIDSDEALQIAEENGGREFRQQADPEFLITSVEAGNLRWYFPEDPDKVFWRVEYASYTSSGVERTSMLVDIYAGVVLSDEEPNLPGSTLLASNYPNPFSGSTTIDLELPTSSAVRVVIYDMLGRQVDVLLDEYLRAGAHSVNWDAADQPNGMYLYRVEAGEHRQTGTMLLVD